MSKLKQLQDVVRRIKTSELDDVTSEISNELFSKIIKVLQLINQIYVEKKEFLALIQLLSEDDSHDENSLFSKLDKIKEIMYFPLEDNANITDNMLKEVELLINQFDTIEE